MPPGAEHLTPLGAARVRPGAIPSPPPGAAPLTPLGAARVRPGAIPSPPPGAAPLTPLLAARVRPGAVPSPPPGAEHLTPLGAARVRPRTIPSRPGSDRAEPGGGHGAAALLRRGQHPERGQRAHHLLPGHIADRGAHHAAQYVGRRRIWVRMTRWRCSLASVIFLW